MSAMPIQTLYCAITMPQSTVFVKHEKFMTCLKLPP